MDENKKYLTEQANQIDVDATENLGAAIEVDPDVAEYMGAFEEKALSIEDAEDGSFDLAEEQSENR